MYDGAEINARWGNAWPTGITHASNHGHEHRPVLMAPVATLLGEPWYLESGSPGGDHAIWLDIEHDAYANGRVGVSPDPAPDGLMRWVIELTDPMGNPVQTEHELLITEPVEAVVARVRRFLAEHAIEGPTQR